MHPRPRKGEKPVRLQACSMGCMHIINREQGVIDPTRHEVAAMEEAGNVAGAYLERLGKTDMAAFSYEEWMGLIEATCTGFVDKMKALYDSGEPPF
jgi:hypothetical protein